MDDPVGKYIPEFAHMNVIKGNNPRPNWFQTEPARSPITVRHLLTHTAGFTYGYTNTTVDALYRRNQVYQYISKRESMDEFIREVSELPLLFHPGEHCISMIILPSFLSDSAIRGSYPLPPLIRQALVVLHWI